MDEILMPLLGHSLIYLAFSSPSTSLLFNYLAAPRWIAFTFLFGWSQSLKPSFDHLSLGPAILHPSRDGTWTTRAKFRVNNFLETKCLSFSILFKHLFGIYLFPLCHIFLFVRDGQCPEYNVEEQAICAIGLAKSRPGIFIEAIQYLLILATPVEVKTWLFLYGLFFKY